MRSAAASPLESPTIVITVVPTALGLVATPLGEFNSLAFHQALIVSVDSPLGEVNSLAASNICLLSVATPMGVVNSLAVSQIYAAALIDTPMGVVNSLAASNICLLSVASPLGQINSLAVSQIYVAALIDTPMGAVLARAFTPSVAVCAVASPLGASTSMMSNDFVAVLTGLSVYYVADLTTPSGIVRVPISSWQATRQTGRLNYLQCVIPACTPHLVTIAATTSFSVSRRAVLPNGTAVEEIMASAPADAPSISRGTANYTTVMTGYGPALAEDVNPLPAYDRPLLNVRAVFTQAGIVRVRCDIDWLLRPSIRAVIPDLSFIVSYINYYVTDNDQYMDVGERPV